MSLERSDIQVMSLGERQGKVCKWGKHKLRDQNLHELLDRKEFGTFQEMTGVCG